MQKPQLNNIWVTLKQKLCRLLSLLLSVTLLFSFPLTSYAADFSISLDYENTIVESSSSASNNPTRYFVNGEPTTWNNASFTSHQVSAVLFTFFINGDFKQDEQIAVEIRSTLGGFAFDSAYVNFEYGGSSHTFSISDAGKPSFTIQQNTQSIKVTIVSNDFRYSTSAGIPFTRLYIGVDYDSEDTSLLRNILQSLQNLPDEISAFFNSLGDRISGFFNSLGDRISGFFTNLVNNLKSWFEDVGDWFSELGDRINDFLTDIGDRISGFFEKLWNRIYWGNENGEAEYQPPVFSSSLDDALDKIDEYIAQLDDTNQEIENAKNTSVAYVEQGTTVINAVFGVFPSIVTALVIFGVVFIFCRKVVGR